MTERIELKEIADYRGNLSFAEQGNPIPFDIKSVFWSTVTTDIRWQHSSDAFIICLNGEIEINACTKLTRANQAVVIDKHTLATIKLLTDNASILILMSEALLAGAKTIINNFITLPSLSNFHGMDGFYANSLSTVPFDIKRVYFTYDIPEFAKRGGHAHRKLSSLIFPLKGSFDLHTETISDKKTTHLSQQNKGYFLKDKTWREITNFSSKSLILVLASDVYKAEDYIRHYDVFQELKRKKSISY